MTTWRFLLWPAAATLLVAAAAMSLAGAPALSDGESSITVSLDNPTPFEPVFGEVFVEAKVVAEEEIERVVFLVDGLQVGEVLAPPYRLRVDLNDEVGEHLFQAVAYALSGATGSCSVRTPALRIHDEVSVSLQQLYVTVSRNGQRVIDLGSDDFEIFDESRRQELVTFARGDIPFTAVLLVDSSVSMEGEKLAAALRGAGAFFRGMQPLDQGKLVVFSDRVLHSTPVTSFPAVLTAGLDRVSARGGTALNDHLYLALKELEVRQGRRVVVLLSDGVDSHSVLSMADVLHNARLSQALVYWLRVPYEGTGGGERLPRLTTSWRNAEGHERELELLRRTVEQSGGRIELLPSIAPVEPDFEAILRDLRDQYVLGYYPRVQRHDGGWREVRVRVRGRDFDVRCQEGYVDF